MTRTDNHPISKYAVTRGPEWIGRVYLVFRQILAFVDLLGSDGRPSSTKIMAASTVGVMLYVARVNVSVRAALANHPDAQVAVAAVTEFTVVSWPMFWILFMCFCVLFGRWGLTMFSDVLKQKWGGGFGA